MILALVFGSFLAFLPLLIGGVSVLATFLIVGGLTEITGISQIVEFLIALVGLGVAIDYSLLVVSRWREERSAGRANAEAVAVAMQHAGRAVVFSGLTVAIGLLSMIVLPVPMLRSVGYGGVLVPLVSVLVAITLLPVILASVGPRMDWPRLRTERRPSRVFSSWAAFVYRHRWVSAAAGLAIMALLIVPALSLHLGLPGASAEATAGPAHDALVSADLRRGPVRGADAGRGADVRRVLGRRWRRGRRGCRACTRRSRRVPGPGSPGAGPPSWTCCPPPSRRCPRGRPRSRRSSTRSWAARASSGSAGTARR